MVAERSEWLLRTIPEECFFQISKWLLLYDFNRFIPTLFGNSFLFWSKTQRVLYIEDVSFSYNFVQEIKLLCFFIWENRFNIQTVAVKLQAKTNRYMKIQKNVSWFLFFQQVVLNLRNRIFSFRALKNSDIESKILRRVCFQIKFFTRLGILKQKLRTCLFLKWKLYLYSDLIFGLLTNRRTLTYIFHDASDSESSFI